MLIITFENSNLHAAWNAQLFGYFCVHDFWVELLSFSEEFKLFLSLLGIRTKQTVDTTADSKTADLFHPNTEQCEQHEWKWVREGEAKCDYTEDRHYDADLKKQRR